MAAAVRQNCGVADASMADVEAMAELCPEVLRLRDCHKCDFCVCVRFVT